MSDNGQDQRERLAKCLRCPLVAICLEIGMFSDEEVLAMMLVLILLQVVPQDDDPEAYKEASHGGA